MNSTAIALALATAALAAGGCTAVRRTDPPRTATEQLLISTAADRAVAKLTLEGVSNKKVLLSDSRFDSYDKLYVISLLEDKLLRLGAKIVKDAGAAEWVVEIRSGAVSVDQDSWLFGIPAMTVPIPMAGGLGIPELAFFKRDTQTGQAKLAWTATNKADGKLAGSVDPQHGTAYVTNWVVLLIPFQTQDVVPDEDDEEDD